MSYINPKIFSYIWLFIYYYSLEMVDIGKFKNFEKSWAKVNSKKKIASSCASFFLKKHVFSVFSMFAAILYQNTFWFSNSERALNCKEERLSLNSCISL